MQVLTAGLKGKLLQGRSAGGEVWRRRTDGVRRRSCRGASPVPGLHRSTRGVPARESRRSGRPGMLRRRGIALAESLTGGVCSALGKAAALGFGVAAAWMGGGAGDRRRFKGASPGISGGGARRDPGGDCGRRSRPRSRFCCSAEGNELPCGPSWSAGAAWRWAERHRRGERLGRAFEPDEWGVGLQRDGPRA